MALDPVVGGGDPAQSEGKRYRLGRVVLFRLAGSYDLDHLLHQERGQRHVFIARFLDAERHLRIVGVDAAIDPDGFFAFEERP